MSVSEQRGMEIERETRMGGGGGGGGGGLQQCTPVTMCMSVNGFATLPPLCIICCQAYLADVDCAQSMQGKTDEVLSTGIYMKVSERIQIMLKMQVSIPQPLFDDLCCLLLHGVGVLKHVVAHLTRAEESVALWTQPNKLLHRHRIQFVLEESDCLAIGSAIEGIVEHGKAHIYGSIQCKSCHSAL